MEKKIIIVSIIAVVILILVSFTSVVGYNSVKSNAKASPLFNIRSSKAVGKESKDIACDYVGKGIETDIHTPSRIRRAEQTQKAVDIISIMDDKAFSRFIGRIINKRQMTEKDTSDMLEALYYIRENPNVMKYRDNGNNYKDITYEYLTCIGFPGCLIEQIAFIIMAILIIIANWISGRVFISCDSAGCPWCDYE